MSESMTAVPEKIWAPNVKFDFETPLETRAAVQNPARQAGGEIRAREVLGGFLATRGREYATRMSSPVTAHDTCSRLSPYLAWGNISIREVFQTTETRAETLRRASPKSAPWLKSLAAFGKRLRWHCHFIQKLEDQPSLEFENMQRACDGLREDQFNQDHFEAWKAGQTGYPMVDACMRALHERKWINFRMRAMLVSFASYHLWLDWRHTAPWLATQFLDYEPGIHYSQFQMQSGTTGINTLRIYSPSKQVLDQDPEGRFIHQWCPELAALSGRALANPEMLAAGVQAKLGVRIGRDYPRPLVDHATVTRAARRRIYDIRKTTEARAESRQVLKKHGSRKRTGSRRLGTNR
jgi:deoxyribodipyrimidine photo-lyase